MPTHRRYPGSLIVRVIVNEYYALLRKYRKPANQPGRFDGFKQWFLRWEGMLFGGLVTSGLVAGAARIYQRERLDDIDRRVERREFYEGSCMMGAAHLAAIQNSLAFWEALLLLSEHRIQQRQQWRQRQQQRTKLAAQQLHKWQSRCGWLCGETYLDLPQQQQQQQQQTMSQQEELAEQQYQHDNQQNEHPDDQEASSTLAQREFQQYIGQEVLLQQQTLALESVESKKHHAEAQQQQQDLQQAQQQVEQQQQQQQQQGLWSKMGEAGSAMLNRFELVTRMMVAAADANSNNDEADPSYSEMAAAPEAEQANGVCSAYSSKDKPLQGEQQQQQYGPAMVRVQDDSRPQQQTDSVKQHHHQQRQQQHQDVVLQAMQQQWNPLRRYALYQLYLAQQQLWQQQQLLVLMEVGQQLWEDMYKLGQQQVHLLKQQEFQQQSFLLAHAGQLAVWQKLETRSSEVLNLGFYVPDPEAAWLRLQATAAAAARWCTGQQVSRQLERQDSDTTQNEKAPTRTQQQQREQWWWPWEWARKRSRPFSIPGQAEETAGQKDREQHLPQKIVKMHVSARLMLPIWVPDEVEERDYVLTSREYAQRIATPSGNI